jgi:hypothetical protein
VKTACNRDDSLTQLVLINCKPGSSMASASNFDSSVANTGNVSEGAAVGQLSPSNLE